MLLLRFAAATHNEAFPRMAGAGTTISVVIPCYNAEEYLRETLGSVVSQTHAPVEVLVVNDGSTDDSAEIAGSYGPPVRVIHQDNRGESVARNRGIDEARGEWVAFIDADDIWKPRKLELQCAAIEDDVVCVHTNVFKFGTRSGGRDLSSIPRENRYELGTVAACSTLFISSLLVRRTASPRFPEWTQYTEDLIYQLELVQQGRVRLVPEPLTGYRHHAANQTYSDVAIEVKKHQVLERWLAEKASTLGPAQVAELRGAFVRKLLTAARKAKRDRHWEAFDAIREYVRTTVDHPEAAGFVKQRVYPRWIYRIKDSVAHRC